MFYGNYVNNVGTRRGNAGGGNGLCGMGMGHAFVLAITFKRRHTPQRRDAGDRRGGGGGTGNCFSMQIHIISRQAALFSSVQFS